MIKRVFLALWLMLVVAVSISPLSFKLRLHTVGPFHDFGHYVVYGLTAIFLCLVARGWPIRVLAFLFGVALSLGQEWIENKIYHAGFEWRDVGTDLAGLVSGFALMLFITSLMPATSAQRPRF